VPFIGWTGFYLGGGWSDVNWANVNLTGERVNNDASNFVGGAQLGYNQQFGSVVLGVEGTLSGASIGDDFRSGKVPAVTYSTGVTSISTLTGRVGFAANQWLVYGKAGWAGAQVEGELPRPAAHHCPSCQGGSACQSQRKLAAVEPSVTNT
jgi:outer membrane immunogenic protein